MDVVYMNELLEKKKKKAMEWITLEKIKKLKSLSIFFFFQKIIYVRNKHWKILKNVSWKII
jgi:hypothetical protein